VRDAVADVRGVQAARVAAVGGRAGCRAHRGQRAVVRVPGTALELAGRALELRTPLRLVRPVAAVVLHTAVANITLCRVCSAPTSKGRL
jgi:hypothetical protein